MIVTTSGAQTLKKRNIIFLFVLYKGDINEHTEMINALGIAKTDSSHLLWLCDEAMSKYDTFYNLDGDNSKVNRWLGFIQAVLIMSGATSVDKERDRTRELLTAHRYIL